MDLASKDYAELLELKANVEAELKRRETEEKAKAKKQILELARLHGLNVEDLLNKSVAVGRKPVEAKYRHPANPDVTWSGRGRQPVWIKEWVDSGKSLEQLAI